MYAVFIPVKMQKDFEREAELRRLHTPLCPESMHALHYKQLVPHLKYEFFTEEDFELAKRIRDNVQRMQANT